MKKVFVLTGEPSGDKLASTVISKLKLQNPNIEYLSVGGTHLKNLGIKSFEKIFLHHGYKKKDYYFFKEKKLNAFWYSHPGKNMPRIFISELIVDDLSKKSH